MALVPTPIKDFLKEHANKDWNKNIEDIDNTCDLKCNVIEKIYSGAHCIPELCNHTDVGSLYIVFNFPETSQRDKKFVIILEKASCEVCGKKIGEIDDYLSEIVDRTEIYENTELCHSPSFHLKHYVFLE